MADEQRDNTAESQTVEDSQTEETTAAPEETSEATDSNTLQETQEADDSTPKDNEAWKNMRLENKRLKEELDKRQKSQSAFDNLYPQRSDAQTIQQAQNQYGSQYVNINQYVDPNTGEFDAQSYNQAVNSRIHQLEQRISQTDQERDEREAREAVPQLNPNDKDNYDPDFEERVAERWLYQNYKGNSVTLKEIALDLSKRENSTTKKARQQGAQQAMESLSEKEQASLDVAPQTSARARQAQSQEERAQLRGRVRSGDEAALTRIMSRIPWASTEARRQT